MKERKQQATQPSPALSGLDQILSRKQPDFHTSRAAACMLCWVSLIASLPVLSIYGSCCPLQGICLG